MTAPLTGSKFHGKVMNVAESSMIEQAKSGKFRQKWMGSFGKQTERTKN
jgi:hypothetical protein